MCARLTFQAHKGLRAIPVLQARKGLKVIPELLEPPAHKGLGVPQVPQVLPEPLARRGLRVIPVLPAHKARKVRQV
jgi:hypothetical protein